MYNFQVLPNIDCPHCVIRARYNSHKPGEDIFFQCADITIKKSQDTNEQTTYNIVRQKHYPDLSNTLKIATNSYAPDSDFVLRGFAYSPFDDDLLYIVKVDMNGEVQPYGQFSFKVNFNINAKNRLQNVHKRRKENYKKTSHRNFEDISVNRMFILNSVVTVNDKNNLVTLYHDDSNMDQPANRIVEFDSQTGNIVHNTAIKNFDGQPINAIVSYTDGSYITFSLQKQGTDGMQLTI